MKTSTAQTFASNLKKTSITIRKGEFELSKYYIKNLLLNKQLIQKHHKLFDLFLSSLPLRTSQYGTEEVIIKKESDILCMSDIKRGAPRI